MIRRVLSLILVLALAAAPLTACSAKHTHEDLTIRLSDDFTDLSAATYAEGLDFLYDNGTIAVAGSRETRADVTAYFGNVDAQRYAELVIEMNGLDCQLTSKNGLLTFSYEATVSDTPLTYVCAIYEAQDSFWQVQAYCATSDFEVQQETMWEIIGTAKVN